MSGSTQSYGLTPLARADLEDIWLYTFERWSPEQADRYHKDIIAAIESLADGSVTGRTVDIRDGYFKHAVGSHLLFYRITDNGLEIVRVLHQRMDVGRHL